eukprot:CAMPEP_0115563698 /NCGR_PEP_ID=MMETSP0271-20121206/102170_1 /TAXON_ID=71861 /ORGANISM="Scrippsiella trochoidea, Strain CCMP3099" /LENGTH=163 /DNA_ID=CAMNT_0002997917 /DNA_START=37 /DNA_END=524 /DNA_ORIENTATION=+
MAARTTARSMRSSALRSRVQCPAGHRMHIDERATNFCNACLRHDGTKQHGTMMRCEECDYDLCIACCNLARCSMTVAEVKLRTHHSYQNFVAIVVTAAVFVDVLGTCIILPSLSSLCAYADGGPVDTIMDMPISMEEKQAILHTKISPHAFQGEKGAWSGRPP